MLGYIFPFPVTEQRPLAPTEARGRSQRNVTISSPFLSFLQLNFLILRIPTTKKECFDGIWNLNQVPRNNKTIQSSKQVIIIHFSRYSRIPFCFFGLGLDYVPMSIFLLNIPCCQKKILDTYLVPDS